MEPTENGSSLAEDPVRTLELALDYHRAGRLADAERIYRELQRRYPGHPAPLHLLGVLAHQRGEETQALELLEQARGADPGDPELLSNLGLVLGRLGRHTEAEARLRQALALAPDRPEPHNNLGGLLLERGDTAAAADCFERCLALAPGHPEALLNLANACLRAGRVDQGLAACRQALAAEPSRAGAHALEGALRSAGGDEPGALACYRRAWALGPDDPDHAYGAALALENLGRWDDALAWYRRALAAGPRHGPALSAALGLAKSLCLWDEAAVYRERFLAGVEAGDEGLTPFILLAEPVPPAVQLACARLWSAQKARAVAAARARLAFDFPGDTDGRITVGYVSPDFRRHPTAYTKVGLFEQHDRERFRVLAYCGGEDDGSAIRRRVVAAVDEFVDTRGWSPERVARRIHRDRVDILVDLKGHTLAAPTEVFALRPAPVQVSYMGYPGSTGADFMDYAVVDGFVVPTSRDRDFSESLVRLPETYWAEDARRTPPSSPPARSELGLPEDACVYCCFNNSFKITREVFDIWCEILQATPGSVLWLQHSNPDSGLAANLSAAARERGVEPARLLMAPRRPLAEYLALYRLADLFLDTLPYNAHTTAADALWAGLPVLTCPGETFASRVAGSLLRAIGLPELVTGSLEAYRDAAIGLGHDPGRRRMLTRALAANRATAPLFDTARFTRHLERAYMLMHARRLQGLGPAPFSVPPLT